MGTDREFSLVGGHPALYLVNTVGWRPDPSRTVDHLPDLPAAVRWAVAAGLLDDAAAGRLAAPQQPDTAADGTAGSSTAGSSTAGGGTAGGGTARAASGGTDRAEAERAMGRLVALRERLYQVLSAVARRRTPDHAVLTLLHADVARAMRRAEPAAGLPLRSTLTVRRPADLVDLLALQAGELLRSADLERLGQCADTGCGWLFLDRTRSHSRRWCSSADCGNRDRARRHYARTHG